jgi:bacterioferritin-associated ferredoxin
MLVCHCKRVNDRTIRTAIRDGAKSIDAVGAVCGAGTSCGGCHETIDGLIGSEQKERRLLPMLAMTGLVTGS